MSQSRPPQSSIGNRRPGSPGPATNPMPLLAQLSERSRALGRPIAAGAPRPSESIRKVALAGWIIIGLFFGVFGAWALSAPLNGAVVANGVIKVESNRKSLQHLDGGIVKELRVKEGDRVNAGDTLIVLDDTQARAEFEVLSQQFAILRATEERLRTELEQRPELQMPVDLRARTDDPNIKGIWNGQVRQFESRLAALNGQRNVIKEKIAQLEHQIVSAYRRDVTLP